MNNPQQPPPNMEPLVPNRRQRRLNRRQRANALPESTDTVLIFPCIGKPLRFYRGSYNPNLTDGRLGMDELNNFFDSIDPILQVELSHINVVKPIFISVIVVVLMLAVAWNIAFGTNLTQYLIALLGFLVFLVVVSFLLVKYVRIKLEKAKSQIQPILDAANERLGPVGLTWFLPPSFPKWISLRKDYKIQNNAGNPPINMGNQFQPVPQVGTNQVVYSNPPYQNYYGGPNDVPQGQYPQNNYPDYQQNGNEIYYPPPQQP